MIIVLTESMISSDTVYDMQFNSLPFKNIIISLPFLQPLPSFVHSLLKNKEEKKTTEGS